MQAMEAEIGRMEEQLRSLGSESWESIKAGVESAWGELEVAFRELSVKPQRGPSPRARITSSRDSAVAGEKSSFPKDDSRDVVD